MDRVVKIIWAISVTSVVFVACNKGGGGAQVNGPRNRNGQLQNQNKNDAQAQGKQAMDPAKMTDVQKATAGDMKPLRPLLRDAASLYGDAWKAIVKSNPTQSPKKETVGNMLKLVSEIIEANFDAAGTPYLKTGPAAATSAASAGTPTGATVKAGPMVQAQAQNQCRAPGFSEVKVVSEMKSTYDIYFAPCEKGSSGQKKIATINRNSKSDQTFSVTWDISTLDASPDRMMGLFMGMNQSGLESGCDLVAMPYGRLGSLNCKNMGQDVSKNEYAMVTSFDFKHPDFDKSRKDHPVTMEFEEFTLKDDNTWDQRPGRMIDDPVSNSLIVNMQGAPKEYMTDAKKAQSVVDAKVQDDLDRAQKEKEQKEKQQSGANANQDASQAQPAAAAAADPKTVSPAGVQQQSQQTSDLQQQSEDGSAPPAGGQSSQDVGPSTSRDESRAAN